ncbi:MAG TPA: ribonuclease PH [Candidatus Omnitrophota bacterium]|nr:ribonuclease PH [Candidatus Omnitrophota bacterium]HRY86076.1 ribonuclease PH [Candidatus Omnitrophota bacterium]
MRIDKRKNNELRSVTVRTKYLKHAHGSCLIEMGDTKVVCSATVEEKVPFFCKEEKKGWITAEYGMLPASCSERIVREAAKGKLSGRTQEIQRLIGRSIRSVVDLKKLGERTIWLDADVIQGDGGTRTASITGCYIALKHAIKKLIEDGLLAKDPVRDSVAAVSVGVVRGKPMLDLCYEEDSKAEVDMNIVMTGSGKLVEVQGTAEGKPFSEAALKQLIQLGKKGIRELTGIQKKHV